jgi:nucleoside-diphosphate-sugar epimerase
MSTVIVTGASGFIGTAVVGLLRSSGFTLFQLTIIAAMSRRPRYEVRFGPVVKGNV